MPYQDLTTYEEVDPNSKLTVTSSKVTAANMDKDEDCYVYKDFGPAYFDEIDSEFECRVESSSSPTCASSLGFANTVDDRSGWSTHLNVQCQQVAGTPRIYLFSPTDDDFYNCSADTTYYCTLQRAAGNDGATLYIYSDASRETLVDTLTVTGCSTSKYQYFYAIASSGSGTGNNNFDGFYQNIDLNLGPAPSAVGSTLGLLAPAVGLYDVRYKLRSRRRDTALTTRVRNT